MIIGFLLILLWEALKIFIPVVIGFILYLFHSLYISRIQRSCFIPPSQSKAYHDAHRMLELLEKPYEKPGKYYRNLDVETLERHGIYTNDLYDGVEKFIRLCHYTGYEVVIRPNSSGHTGGDTELNPDQTDSYLRDLYSDYKSSRVRNILG